ncbi:MAG: hypothetical protein WBV82_03865 [Myxococcaceae bacterium]
MSRITWWFPALLLAAGCASVGPRFSPEIATSFAREDMRRLETKSLVVYYPASAREAALRTAARLEACTDALRNRAVSQTERGKMVVLVTSAEYNNAFVRAQMGGIPTEMVVPLHMGLEVFNFYDMGVAEIADVSCHEAVHYVQMEQTDGFWRYVNLVFGDLMSPNVFTETWFLEGLATYLEGNLGHEQGRPHSPLYRASFDSGIASQGEIRSGNLNPNDRELLPFGGNYLSGSRFVEWLAKTHGEEKLWEFVDLQGRSILSPVGVTLRFKKVYGRTIGSMLDAYSREYVAALPDRRRPDAQTVLAPGLGYQARLAASPSDGALATISVGLEQVVRLTVREADGSERFSRSLVQVLPGREWIVAHPSSVSGFTFSRDGRHLFFLSEDVDIDGGSTYALRQFDAHSGEYIRSWPGLRGIGGDLTPDGAGYVYVALDQDRSNLVRLDLRTGAVEPLTSFQTRESLGAPAVSPDGKRVAFSRRGRNGFDLYLREANGSLRQLTNDGRFNYSSQWMNDHTLVFLREHEGRPQAHALRIDDGELRVLTDAPWAVMDPVVVNPERIAFLNREAWHWTLDAMPVTQMTAATGTPTSLAAVPEPVFGDREDGTVRVLSDDRYSVFDELFIPRLRVPGLLGISFGTGRVGAILTASLHGHDRLGLHGWAINATWNTFQPEPSVSLAYGNHQLAPWYLSVAVSRSASQSSELGLADPVAQQDVVATHRNTDWRVSLNASRSFWTTNVGFGLDALQRDVRVIPVNGDPDRFRSVRLFGPSAGASWFAGESTPYSGTRRGLGLDGSVTGYPRALGSEVDLLDLRAGVTAYVPLPVLARHTFAVGVRGRALVGRADRMLQLGGIAAGDASWALRSQDTPQPGAPEVFLPGVAFSEPLRGFDDYAFRVNAAAILSARYRYPLVIDRGTTTFLWLAPSFFVRQLDLEGFFEGIQTDDERSPRHAAVGAMAKLRTVWGSSFPISVFYQYAWRTTPGLGSQHVVGLSFD